jgi:probable DNA repair protein
VTTLLTLTAGNRLARWLHDEHARAAMARGETVWETPAILPWSAWLEQLWDAALETGALGRHPPIRLVDGQALALWESIIREWDGGPGLLQSSATAELAFEAWLRLHEWQAPASEEGSDEAASGPSMARGPRFDPISDHRAFAAWAKNYRAALERHHWLDRARLIDALIPAVRARRLPLPDGIVLRGFDEFTPAQQALIDALRESGVAVTVETGPTSPANACRVAFPSLRDEVEAAARFALARWQANPQARIGIVVPELARHHALVSRLLDDILAPAARLPGGATARRPYNLSLGRALADVSPVAEALAMLQASVRMSRTNTMLLATASAWLRSPCVAGAAGEWAARSRLAQYLRAGREPEVSLRFLHKRAAGDKRGLEPCPQAGARLHAWQQRLAHLSARAMPSHWVPVLTELLSATGWPGDRPRDSHEHQALEHWRDLLGELRHYDAVTGAINFESVVARVQTLARATIFQPQSPMVPVQVLGLLETSGLQFDHLWVLGLQDDNWPPAPRPHPFIPVSVQRRHGMPHSTPERELAFARERTAHLLFAAPEAVFSHARRDGDRELSPSPLLSGLPERAPELLALAGTMRHAESIYRQRQLEPWRDDRAPALAGGEAGGGTGLFKQQSACPFRAFAELRLRAGSPPSDRPGLDPPERGSLVHQMLEKVWIQLRDHAALATLDEAALLKVVESIVDEVVGKAARFRPFTWTPAFRTLEKERLIRLAMEWLALERQRPPFEVLACEARQTLAVGPVTVTARIDRIDRLADGNPLVIDYKTGSPSIKDWLGERPREPQLPLYALYGSEPTAAIAFAQVRRGEHRWRGLAARDTGLPGVVTAADADTGSASWEELRHHWQAALERLAQAFHDGEAAVDPREPKVCKECHLPTLCRIREREHRAGKPPIGDEDDD